MLHFGTWRRILNTLHHLKITSPNLLGFEVIPICCLNISISLPLRSLHPRMTNVILTTWTRGCTERIPALVNSSPSSGTCLLKRGAKCALKKSRNDSWFALVTSASSAAVPQVSQIPCWRAKEVRNSCEGGCDVGRAYFARVSYHTRAYAFVSKWPPTRTDPSRRGTAGSREEFHPIIKGAMVPPLSRHAVGGGVACCEKMNSFWTMKSSSSLQLIPSWLFSLLCKNIFLFTSWNGAASPLRTEALHLGYNRCQLWCPSCWIL